MAIKELSDQRIREWSVEQKDRWWLENVYRGDMPQLTIRSAITGMFLGGLLSLSNLYVGAKIGAGFGVATTAVVLAFAAFRGLSAIRLGRDFTLLENNAMQSIATAAGYMTSALISSLPAYMAIIHHTIPMWQSMCWIIAISLLGALFAFPLKRRLINDEQLPFPEGRAAGRVMEALHSDEPGEGLFKTKILAIAAGLGACIETVESGLLTLRGKPLTFSSLFESVSAWISRRSINGHALKELGVGFGWNTTIFAVGGLLGIRIGLSFLIGAVLNYCVLAPWIISLGDISMRAGRSVYDVRAWSVWSGAAMLTTASILPLLIDWRKINDAILGLFDRKRDADHDPLRRIEVPARVFAIGIPLVSVAVITMGYCFFDINPLMGLIAIPLVFLLTIIAANTTAHTGQTPSGAMGKITQLIYAGLAPNTITTNVMTAGLASDAAISGSSLLQDIKPGYMLGAKPRHQAIGHVLGIIVGSIAATMVAYRLFFRTYIEKGSTEQWPMPSADVWQAVAKVLSGGASALPRSALYSAIAFALAGVVFEWLRRASKGRFPVHPIGVGFAMVIPYAASFMLFAGAFTFWLAGIVIRRGGLRRILVDNSETLCAGLLTGASLAGIVIAMYQEGLFGELLSALGIHV
ncbi:MAG TPA: OPT family oligopeptide transporter [Phycisphaerae bacterium]|nr:OPT family oligopeptide transporter [Phycisphaerae bacterium]HRW54467.1 OPT family oligopeptide transporter [Phycisphaerae bacterium]